MPKPTSKRLDTQVTPDPALEKRTRRKFSVEYKLRIIAEADSCKYGELSGLLRRENYTVARSPIGDESLQKMVCPD